MFKETLLKQNLKLQNTLKIVFYFIKSKERHNENNPNICTNTNA